MTENLSTSSGTTQRSIVPEIGDLLRILSVKPTENGIYFYIQPLTRCVLAAPLKQNEVHDLIHSIFYIPAGQNYLFVQTNQVSPIIYKEEINYSNDDMDFTLPDVGQPIAKIIQFL